MLNKVEEIRYIRFQNILYVMILAIKSNIII